MALINIPAIPTPITLTDVQKQARTVARIKAKSTNLFKNIKSAYLDLASEVSANKDGLSSDEVLTALGADAASFNALGTSVAALLNQAAPDTIPTPADVAPASSAP